MNFTEYCQSQWMNIGTDERGTYITSDPKWTAKTMRSEGWNVRLTGDTQLMPDDSIRHYVTI